MSDLVSRQDAIDKLRYMGYMDEHNEVEEALMRLPSVEPKQQWIPVTEQLPEVGEYVICSQINGDVGEGKLLDDGYWHICYDQSHRRKTWVVAWQPLPESYREVKE